MCVCVCACFRVSRVSWCLRVSVFACLWWSLCRWACVILCLRVSARVQQGKAPATDAAAEAAAAGGGAGARPPGRTGLPPIVVNLNSSSSELKLLRVLQTLVNLSGKDTGEIFHLIFCH